MEYVKFILSGEDRKTLAAIKNALISSGHIFTGYSKECSNLLRHVRNLTPDMLIIDVGNSFKDVRQMLEVIDEEMLAACILIIETKNDEIIEMIKKSHIISYIVKPVFDEVVLQIVDLSLINYRRVQEYESKVKKLNDTLESRKIVEKAKWILVEKEGFTENDAYESIKKKSRDNRIPMKDIAEAIILTRG